jgi:hypothetical protein
MLCKHAGACVHTHKHWFSIKSGKDTKSLGRACHELTCARVGCRHQHCGEDLGQGVGPVKGPQVRRVPCQVQGNR